MKIKGFEGYDVSEEGVVTNTRTGRVLKVDLSGAGYPRVTLSQDGNLKRIVVHRLVATHYIPNWLDAPMINHIDGDKLNNSVHNLEWVTCQQNTVHAFSTGLRAKGKDHWNAKLDDETVICICEEVVKGLTRGEILSQDRFSHVSKYAFDDIRRKKSWKHITSKYNWKGATTISKESTPKWVEAPSPLQKGEDIV
jgi:hypothetical protein